MVSYVFFLQCHGFLQEMADLEERPELNVLSLMLLVCFINNDFRSKETNKINPKAK